MASKAVLRTGTALAIVGMTTGAWFAGKQVRSPAQAAATANPPVASRITAPVEERELSSSVIVRGVVRYGDPRAVVLAASTVKNASAGAAGAVAIISSPAVKGAELPDGSSALTVGGRPVFVFEGKVPAYRDLRPGDRGDDVRQLEEALQRFQMNPGPVDGLYDRATESAVERWYTSKGYAAFGPTDAQRTQLRSLRDLVSRATDATVTARQNLDATKRANSADRTLAAQESVRIAKEKVTTSRDEAAREQVRFDNELEARRSALTLAERAVVLAEQSLAKAQRDSTDMTPVADSEDAVATAQSQVRQARIALDDAVAQVPLADSAVADAVAALDTARKDLDLLKKTKVTIPQADPSVVVLIDQSANTIRAAEGLVRQSEAAVRSAEAARTAAARAVETRQATLTDAERAVARAEAAIGRARQSVTDRGAGVEEVNQRLVTAKADVEKARRELQATEKSKADAAKSAAVVARQARGGVSVAEAQLRDAKTSGSTAAAAQQLESAQQSKERAQTELNELERQVGIVVPANEILFFPTLPLRVDDVRALRGDVVTGPVMTVTTARLAVDSSVDVAQAKLVRRGSSVVIESTEFNVVLNGTVTEIATTTGTKGADPGKVYLEVTPNEGEKTEVDPKDLNGSSVKLTIPIRSTGKAVLAVPVAAVSIAADGASRVEVEESPGAPTKLVRVRTGLAAEGYVEVTPIDGTLTAGTQVVVGNREGAVLEGTTELNDESSDTVASDSSDSSEADSSETDSSEADSSEAAETSTESAAA
jgi:peptidoglycan hydrolase-like protein with peptidoglycan-binding domain